MQFNLSPIDLILVWGYLIGVVIVGLWYGRKTTTSMGFWLAGRDMAWPFIGMSLWATHIDTADILGRVGGSYRDGVYTVFRIFADALFNSPILALIFVPIYLRIGIVTTPEFLEKRFNYPSRFTFSVVNIINRAIMLSMVMFGGGLIFKAMMGWDVMQSVIVLALLAGTYTIVGGLRSVIITDMIQGVLLLIGLVVIVPFAVNAAGGFGEIAKALTPAQLDPFPPTDLSIVSTRNNAWPVPFLTFMIINSYMFQNYELLQRVLASKDVQTARRGIGMYMILTLVFNFLMAILAVCAMVKYKDMKPIDNALPQLMVDTLPPIILGIGIIALMASIMSTVDSIICANSTLFTRDIWQRIIRPKASDNEILQTSRVVTLILLLFAIWFSQFVPQLGGLFWLTNVINAVLSQVFVTFIVGMFWPRAAQWSAFTGLLAGTVVALVLQPPLSTFWLQAAIHPGYVLLFGSIVNFVVIVVGSFFETPPSAEQLRGTTAYEYEEVETLHAA
jgi:SSS family solute:Na+ symporter